MTGESVEQAALRRARGEGFWEGRARREAAAILDSSSVTFFGVGTITNRDEMLTLLAAAWLQGMNLGSHETLSDAERAFDRLRDAL